MMLMSGSRFLRAAGSAFSVAVLIGFCASGAAAKAKFKVQYLFCSGSDSSCTHGLNPSGREVVDAKGNVFGTTVGGGKGHSGVVYELRPNGTQTVIYYFCQLEGCNDGSVPRGLIIDKNGNLYGTTAQGGMYREGIIFELVRVSQKKWELKVLHDFCAETNCADGEQPASTLTYDGAQTGAPYDGKSPLYGTTPMGGANNSGVAYRLSFESGNKARYDVLYSFCAKQGCTDGSTPSRELAIGDDGNIYGTAAGGDVSSDGVVFQLTPKGHGFEESVIYGFCKSANCADGASPTGMTIDAQGNLIGSTASGGINGKGAIFKLIPDGDMSQEAVLYSFCSLSGCADGASPKGGVTLGANGDIYGVTSNGGTSSDGGVVYRIRGATETALHAFCSEDFCTDGFGPDTAPTVDARGTLHGSTELGGADTVLGTLFKIAKP